MLPKVASHILHTSTRAAAAVQNQAAFRNVFHQSPGFFDSTGAPLVPSSNRRSSSRRGSGDGFVRIAAVAGMAGEVG